VRAVRRLAAVPFLLVLTASVTAAQPLPPELKGGEKLAALLQRVSEVQRGTTSLEAAFEQRRVTRLLAEPSVMSGRFYFRAPAQVRWEYTSPRPMTVVIDQQVAVTYRPEEKRAERVEIGRVQRRFFHLMGAAEPLDALRSYFAFTLRDPGGEANYTLLLQPSTSQLRRRVGEVTIEIDRGRFLPVAVSYAEPDGDSTAYTFTDIVRNRPLDDERFHLDLPPEVDVVTIKLRSGE